MCVCANACVIVRVQVLIIDQGSIIDRIDYNMEKTAEQTQQVNTRARARTHTHTHTHAASDYFEILRESWCSSCVCFCCTVCAIHVKRQQCLVSTRGRVRVFGVYVRLIHIRKHTHVAPTGRDGTS
jgi:hypothetical protein